MIDAVGRSDARGVVPAVRRPSVRPCRRGSVVLVALVAVLVAVPRPPGWGCRGVALVAVLVGRCRRPWSPVLRAGRPVPSPSVVVPPCPVGVVPSPCPTWWVVRVSRGGCRGGAVKVLSSSGCRRRRAVGLSLSSRRRSSWSPWSPSCRRPSVSPRVGVAYRAVAVLVARPGRVGRGRWVSVGRGRSPWSGVVRCGGRYRGSPSSPCRGRSRPPWWGVVVPLVGGQAYFSLPIGYTRRHPNAPPIITDYRQLHRKKLPKAPKSSQNLRFSRFFTFRCPSGCRGCFRRSSPVGLSLSPVGGRPVSCPRPCPRRSVSVGVSGSVGDTAPARRTIGKNPRAVAPFRVGFLSIKTDSRATAVRNNGQLDCTNCTETLYK